jgi:hypothetical protein
MNMTRLFKPKYLIKIGIRHAFRRIRMITEADEHLITFRTRFGFYKYRVLAFVVAYLDDILVYSHSLEEHREHVKAQRCRNLGPTLINANFTRLRRSS